MSKQKVLPLHERLWAVCPIKGPYESGHDTNEHYKPDCSVGCIWFESLQAIADWGVCSCPFSPRAGLLTFEHQGCAEFKAKRSRRSPREGQTKSQVLSLRSQNPQLRATEIALQVGVSRERVRQILQKAGLPTSFISGPHRCGSCGKTLTYNVRKFGMCMSCLKASRHSQVYEGFICEICGQPFERRMAEVRVAQKRVLRIRWCSKACQGKAMGKARWKVRQPVGA